MEKIQDNVVEDSKAMEDKTEKAERTAVTREYDCGEECRICPFPGAKCVSDPEIFKNLN